MNLILWSDDRWHYRLALALFGGLLASCGQQSSPPLNDPSSEPVVASPPTGDQTKIAAEFRQGLLDAHTPVVLSYYWPISKEGTSPRNWTMSSPNVVDILAHEVHGTREIRDYWRGRGKILLNRVSPFHKTLDPDKIYADFAQNIVSADGISVDEILIHKYRSQSRTDLTETIERLRAQFPQKLIFVWDASKWSKETAPLLQRIAASVDAFALEIYISKDDARSDGIGELLTRLNEVESLAPGIKSNVLIGIGAYVSMRDDESDDLSDHLIRQIRFIGCEPAFVGTLGVAVYAPLYLSLDEQSKLDRAITDYIVTDRDRRDCNPRH